MHRYAVHEYKSKTIFGIVYILNVFTGNPYRKLLKRNVRLHSSNDIQSHPTSVTSE